MPADENGSGGEAQPLAIVDLGIFFDEAPPGTGTSPPADYRRLAKALCCVFARRVEMARKLNQPIPTSLMKWVEWVESTNLQLCTPGKNIPSVATEAEQRVYGGGAASTQVAAINVGQRTLAATNQFFSATVAELDDWNEV